MKFCSCCQRFIKKQIVPEGILYKCICSNIEESNPEDVLISNFTTEGTQSIEMYNNLIEFAPYDRTNQLVKQDCPNCGLDYLTQIRIGESEIIVYRCKCGYKRIVD
jgi:DNA-directed RNA polymerase subunit M/transcription elongation factor TFIIS